MYLYINEFIILNNSFVPNNFNSFVPCKMNFNCPLQKMILIHWTLGIISSIFSPYNNLYSRRKITLIHLSLFFVEKRISRHRLSCPTALTWTSRQGLTLLSGILRSTIQVRFTYRVFIKYCVFPKILKYSRLWHFSVFPSASVCVHTPGR